MSDAINRLLSIAPQALQSAWGEYNSMLDSQYADQNAQYARDAAAWANRQGLFGTSSAQKTMDLGRAKLMSGQAAGKTQAAAGMLTPVLSMMNSAEEGRLGRDWQSNENLANRNWQSGEYALNRQQQLSVMQAEYENQLRYADALRQARIADYVAGINAYRQMFPDWNKPQDDLYNRQMALYSSSLDRMAMQNALGGNGGGFLQTGMPTLLNQRPVNHVTGQPEQIYAQAGTNNSTGGGAGFYSPSVVEQMMQGAAQMDQGPPVGGYELPPGM